MASRLLPLLLCFAVTAVRAEAMECVTRAAGAESREGDSPLSVPPALAPGFATANRPLGAPHRAPAVSSEHWLAAGTVLKRVRLESCLALRIPAERPAGEPSAPSLDTSYRFDMSQNGKLMTADEFTAWMEARGLRVAKGAAKSIVAPAPPSGVTPAPDAPKKKKSK